MRSSGLGELALQLVNIPSVSRQEQAITSWIADYVAERTPHLTILHRQAEAIVFGPPGPHDVILAGHCDTVPVQDNLPGRLEHGWVHGLGASDMKGALAVLLMLASDLQGPKRCPLFVIFGREELPPEESVLQGLLVDCPAIREVPFAVMLEPTANRIQAGCLGSIKAELTFAGVAAHSARPWLGINAIHQAVQGLLGVATGQPAEVDVGGLVFREVVSVTGIRGGTAFNVIPDRVVCDINYRYAGSRSPEEAERQLRELLGPAGELRILANAPGGPVDLAHPGLERLRSLVCEPVEPKQAWTPVAEFASAGIKAVNFGPGNPEFAHRRDERIEVKAMERNLTILHQFLED
jgi:succinyl-diaminopimelate desuccinylase